MILLCIAEVGSSSTDLLASYWRTDNHIKSLKLIKQATRYPLPPEYLSSSGGNGDGTEQQKRRTKDGTPTLSIMEVVCQQQWLHYCPNITPNPIPPPMNHLGGRDGRYTAHWTGPDWTGWFGPGSDSRASLAACAQEDSAEEVAAAGWAFALAPGESRKQLIIVMLDDGSGSPGRPPVDVSDNYTSIERRPSIVDAIPPPFTLTEPPPPPLLLDSTTFGNDHCCNVSPALLLFPLLLFILCIVIVIGCSSCSSSTRIQSRAHDTW
ncbi:hypothetical protein QTP88_008481 [Uroleucon formosanum]